MWDTARTPFRVWPTDLDLLMHMNNGKYLSLMDLGRMDLMIRSGWWKTIQQIGWYPVVADQTISYRRSLNPFVRFTLHSRILGLNERGVFMEQLFTVKGRVYARAVIRARFLKKSGGTVAYEELLELLDNIPADRVVPDWVVEWSEQNRDVPKTI